jgi:hypothetical protein
LICIGAESIHWTAPITRLAKAPTFAADGSG